MNGLNADDGNIVTVTVVVKKAPADRDKPA
jgi:hypothetical protein